MVLIRLQARPGIIHGQPAGMCGRYAYRHGVMSAVGIQSLDIADNEEKSISLSSISRLTWYTAVYISS